MKNAQLGLVLVFFVLAFFLDFRLAFWVSMGIPITFLGSFWLLPASGATINMISLFAYIVTLGLVESAVSQHPGGHLFQNFLFKYHTHMH